MRQKVLSIQFNIIKYFCFIGIPVTLYIAYFTDSTVYRQQLKSWYLLSIAYFLFCYILSLILRVFIKERPPKTLYEYAIQYTVVVILVVSLVLTLNHQKRVLSYWFQKPLTITGKLTDFKMVGPDDKNLEYIEFKLDSSKTLWRTSKVNRGAYYMEEAHFTVFRNREVMVIHYPMKNIVISVRGTVNSGPNLYLYRSQYFDADFTHK